MVQPSCINGKEYKIIKGFNGEDFHVESLPAAWLEYINRPKQNYAKSAPRELIKDIDIEKMFDKCQFLQYCKKNANILSEPMWHSMVTVLSQIEDSEELIHKLSRPYPKYRYAETQNKINEARKFGHPQSCAYISSNYPEVCNNCNSAHVKEVK